MSTIETWTCSFSIHRLSYVGTSNCSLIFVIFFKHGITARFIIVKRCNFGMKQTWGGWYLHNWRVTLCRNFIEHVRMEKESAPDQKPPLSEIHPCLGYESDCMQKLKHPLSIGCASAVHLPYAYFVFSYTWQYGVRVPAYRTVSPEHPWACDLVPKSQAQGRVGLAAWYAALSPLGQAFIIGPCPKARAFLVLLVCHADMLIDKCIDTLDL